MIEERLESLESEVEQLRSQMQDFGKFSENVETNMSTLANNYTVIQEFLKTVFGSKFLKFCLLEDPEAEVQDDSNENVEMQTDEFPGPEDTTQFKEDEDGDVEYVDQCEDENIDSGGTNVYEHEDEDNFAEDETVFENDNKVNKNPVRSTSNEPCPSELLAVQIDCDDEYVPGTGTTKMNSQQFQRQQQLNRLHQSSSQRRTNRMIATAKSTVRNSGAPGNSMKFNQRRTTSHFENNTSSGSSGSRVRPPPPLIERPTGGQASAISSNKRSPPPLNKVQTNPPVNTAPTIYANRRDSLRRPHRPSSSSPNRGSQGFSVPQNPSPSEALDGGTGKYAQFYKKVDAELIQCVICKKVLKRRGKFIQHLRTHTGEKPFKCEFCGAEFSRRDNMNVHISRHHNTDQGNNPSQSSRYANVRSQLQSTLGCDLCGDHFWNEDELNYHMENSHGITYLDSLNENDDSADADQMYYQEAD